MPWNPEQSLNVTWSFQAAIDASSWADDELPRQLVVSLPHQFALM